MDWGDVPLSQVANDAFESYSDSQGLGATDFSGILRNEHTRKQEPEDRNGFSLSSENEPVPRPTHGKLFTDPIHGAYRLSPESKLIFDTRQFQRLRRLKQLGMAYYVFPGATHNRFEHSLGTAHLAHKFAFKLWSQQTEELDIERRDLTLVELAGLCHDLGHGPYSHVFENEFLRQCGVTTWTHENMSAEMVDYIIEDNYIDTFQEDDIKIIKSLITSARNSAPGRKGRKWLGDIVANGRNSIDVDKFDYLQRDAYFCGRKVSCDFDRIIQFSKVIDDEICYKYTEYMNLYELFHSRATMHRSVYTHKKAKAIEFMIVDALLEANHALNIVDRIWHPSDFVRLDDGIVDIIENFDIVKHLLQLEDNQQARDSISKAQKIISRLRRRDLYKYVTDAPIPVELVERGHFQVPTAQNVVDAYRGPEELRPNVNDVIVRDNKINFAMKNRNPLDQVSFFDSLDSISKRKLKPEQISSMVVAAYEERQLRVYTRNSDPKNISAVHKAFESWVKERLSVECSTPAKNIRPGSLKTSIIKAANQIGDKRRKILFGSE